jgi:hypothetical protein
MNEYVILPLFSEKGGLNVPEKSGLNQWNAGGRERNYNEVYISIPPWIHETFQGFFPTRDKPFDLILPNGETLYAKVCQDNSKALMSNPNKDLGNWILREVLKLEIWELATLEHLEKLNVGCVIVCKSSSSKYYIECSPINTYFKFKNHFTK